jgi:putative glutamine amidotransferase
VEQSGRRVDSVRREHVDGVVAAGGVPVVLPVLDPGLVDAALAEIDGLLLTGGGDVEASGSPAGTAAAGVDTGRDGFELALVLSALEAGLPILGVGRGHQVLNVALGGSLAAHVPAISHDVADRIDRPVHQIRIAGGSLLAAVVGATSLGVNSLHNRAVEVAGAGLQVVARSEDGFVEAVEGLGDLRVVGVQWRPELLGDLGAAALFRWLVRESGVPAVVDLTEPSAFGEVGPRPAPRPGRAVA